MSPPMSSMTAPCPAQAFSGSVTDRSTRVTRPRTSRAASGSRRRGCPGRGTSPEVPPLVSVVPSVSTPAAPSGVNDGSTSGIVTPATARSSIATTSSPIRRPLGNPAASPPRSPVSLGFFDGGIATLSRSMSDSTVPGEVLEPGHDSLRDAGEQDRVQVRPRLVVRLRGAGTRRVEHRQQPGQLGVVDVLREQRVALGSPGVPHVLVGHRGDDLVEQRVAQPRDLLPRPVTDVLALGLVEHPRLAPAGRRPDADDGVRACAGPGGMPPCRLSSEIGTWSTIECTLKPWSELTPLASARRDQVQVLERTQRAQVEDTAQVDVERVGPLPGEDPALADLVHGLPGQVRVVRGAARADVDRRARRGARRCFLDLPPSIRVTE